MHAARACAIRRRRNLDVFRPDASENKTLCALLSPFTLLHVVIGYDRTCTLYTLRFAPKNYCAYAKRIFVSLVKAVNQYRMRIGFFFAFGIDENDLQRGKIYSVRMQPRMATGGFRQFRS